MSFQAGCHKDPSFEPLGLNPYLTILELLLSKCNTDLQSFSKKTDWQNDFLPCILESGVAPEVSSFFRNAHGKLTLFL